MRICIALEKQIVAWATTLTEENIKLWFLWQILEKYNGKTKPQWKHGKCYTIIYYNAILQLKNTLLLAYKHLMTNDKALTIWD